mgnify:CR=1 FL=1
MKTLEVAVLDTRAGGGAVRAANIVALRRASGVKDCRTIPIIPPQTTIDPGTVATCPPIGFARLPTLIQKAPLPGSWKTISSPAKIMYKLLDKNYNPDVIISHHENIDSVKIAEHLSRSLGSKSITILQLPPFYGDKRRFEKIQESINRYWWLVTSIYRLTTPSDIIHYSYAKLILPLSRKLTWNFAKKLLQRFNAVLAISPSIPLEMGDEWADRVIPFQGCGLHEKELELLLRFRSSPLGSSKPYIVFPARMTVVKGVADLILASLLMKRYIPNFKLLIVGSAGRVEEDRVRRIIQRLGLSGNIVYLGFIRRDLEYWDLRRKAKLTIYPSHVDSFSYTVLESLLLGVPVVAYDIPALRLNYRGVEGLYLVEEGDIEALAMHTVELLEKSRVEVGMPPARTIREVALEEKMLIEKVL